MSKQKQNLPPQADQPTTSKRKIGKQIIKLGVFLTLSVFAFLSYTYFTQAQIPDFVNYQGRLRDGTGNPITAPTTIQFSLYSHITNGSPSDTPAVAGPLLWTETYDGSGGCTQITPGADGIFAQHLGDCVSFPDYLDFTQEYYLGVKIGSDAEATPRVPLSTHPYAFTAKRLHVEGGDLVITNTDTSGNIVMNTAGGMSIAGSNAGFQGAVYNADYSANFVDRSLVDKGYVDGAILTGANTLYLADGTLSGDRTVTSNGNELRFTGSGGNSLSFEANDAPDSSFVHVNPDEIEIDVSNAGSHTSMVFNAGGSSFNHSVGAGNTSFYVGNDMVFTDTLNSRGVEYGADYSANFVDRSLVDKEYVDSNNHWVANSNALTTVRNDASGGGANGDGSVAIGVETHANGWGAFAGGYRSLTGANNSFAFGYDANASGGSSVAFGRLTESSGWNSMASGRENEASGNFSVAMNYKTTASGDGSVSTGLSTQSSGDYSLAGGVGTRSPNMYMTALGQYNVGTDANTLFELGIGVSVSNRANALEIFRDGTINTPANTIPLINSRGNRALVTKEYVDTSISAGNIYGTNGSLTGDRTVNTDGYDLTFYGTQYSSIKLNNQDEIKLGNYYSNITMDWEHWNMHMEQQMGGDYTDFNIGHRVTSITSNYATFAGIQYGADYSANFVDRSLVDKGYVDNHVGALTWQDTFNNELAATPNYIYAGTPSAEFEDDGSSFMMQSKVGKDMSFGATNMLTFEFNGGAMTAKIDDSRAVGNRRGIEYDADYSADFTNRSLVDKGYVDGAVTASNGLTKTGNDIRLGGSFSDNIFISNSTVSNRYFLVNNRNSSGQGSYVHLESGTGDNKIRMYYSNGTNSSGFDIGDNQFVVYDAINSRGLEYKTDYSANYTNRTLVDKEYVDGMNHSMWDHDHDTGISVERNTDEDIIRFDTAGVERLTIDGYNTYLGTEGENYFNIVTDGVSGDPGYLQFMELNHTILKKIGSGGDTSDLDISTLNNTGIQFITNGQKRARFDSSGRLGLGDTTPTYKLDVNGKIGIGDMQTIYNADAEDGFTGTLVIGDGGGSLSNTSGTEAYYNTFVGLGAGNGNTIGANNTSLGYRTFYSNTTGSNNTVIGLSSLYNNTTGSNNTTLGLSALNGNTVGNMNIAIGTESLNSNVANSRSTAIGFEAMHYADNRATGRETFNTAVGFEALSGSTTASNNTGQYNTAIGDRALFSNTSGYSNSSNGVNTLYANSTGYYNTANGANALHDNTTGYNNSAVGANALYSNTTGYENAASGTNALYSNTTGNANVASGLRALYLNTVGDQNTANGVSALSGNTTGGYNTASGTNALYVNTAGNFNTAVGVTALSANTTGNYNTAVGYRAFVSGSNYMNAMALGHNAQVTASNRVRIGDANVTRIGGQVGWSNLSDRRKKENIKDSDLGLDFILDLRPVTFNFREGNTHTLQTGLIAQEVEESLDKLSINFSGLNKPENDNDYYSLEYASFVTPLINAVQEQQTQIKESSIKIESNTLKTDTSINTLTELQTSVDSNLAMINQTLVAVNKEQGTINNRIETIVNEQKVINGKIDDNTESLATLSGSINSLTELTTALTETVASHETRITKIETILEEEGIDLNNNNTNTELPEVLKTFADNLEVLKKDDKTVGFTLEGKLVVEEVEVEKATIEELRVKRIVITNQDIAGEVQIKEGKKKVKIKFDEEYDNKPYVTAVVNNRFTLYKVTDVSTKGFEIVIPEDADEDIEFTWQVAVGVN